MTPLQRILRWLDRQKRTCVICGGEKLPKAPCTPDCEVDYQDLLAR